MDTTLNLPNGTYKPHHKQNDNFKYINFESNHPRSTKATLIENMSWRLSLLSFDESIFKASVDYYNRALELAGYTEKLRYIHTNKQKQIGLTPSGNNKDKLSKGKLIRETTTQHPYLDNVRQHVGNYTINNSNKIECNASSTNRITSVPNNQQLNKEKTRRTNQQLGRSPNDKNKNGINRNYQNRITTVRRNQQNLIETARQEEIGDRKTIWATLPFGRQFITKIVRKLTDICRCSFDNNPRLND